MTGVTFVKRWPLSVFFNRKHVIADKKRSRNVTVRRGSTTRGHRHTFGENIIGITQQNEAVTVNIDRGNAQLKNHRTAEPQNHSYSRAREPSSKLWDRRTTELKMGRSATTEQHATQMQKNTMIRMRRLQNHRNAEPQNHSYFRTREPSTELWNHRTTELENYKQDKHWNTVTEHMHGRITKMRPMNHRTEQPQLRKN